MPQETRQTTTRDWCAVIFALVLPTFVTLVYFVWAERFPAAVQQTTYLVAKIIQFGFPLVWVCWVQRRRPQWWPWHSQGLLLGIGFGLVVAAAMLGLFHGWFKSAEFFIAGREQMQAKIAGIGLADTGKFALLGIFYSVCHSLLEEYYWRWFVFGQLRSLTRLVPAVVISSLGFMAHHVVVVGSYFGYASPLTWFISISIAIGGAFWAWLYNRSGSLLGPWVSHLLVDAAIFIAGYDILREMVSV